MDEPPGMIPSSQPEESLGVGFERQYEGLKAFQDQLSKYGDDLQKLQAQCTRLKRERTSLQQDKANQEREYKAKEGEMSNLTRVIENLRGERDSLQIELAAMCEEEKVWRSADQAGLHELDRAGRLARQLWLRNEEANKLRERLSTIGDEHEEKLRNEARVASDLRIRIAQLERKLRDAGGSKSTSKDDSQRIQDLEHKNAVLKEELKRTKGHYEDALASLKEQSKAQSQLTARLETLEEDWRSISEELRVVKLEKKSALDACAALKKQLEASRSKQTHDDHSRVLRDISPNVSTRSAPSTPTKSQPIDEAQLAELSPKSKDQAFRHLMQQNELLKKQLDRERTKRAANIKHFREYKAVQDERKALKQKRREEKSRAEAAGRSTNATPVSSSVPPPSSDPPVPAEDKPRPTGVEPSRTPRLSSPRVRAQQSESAAAKTPAAAAPRDEPQPGRVRSASTSKASTPVVPKQEHNTPLRRTTTGVPTPSAGAPSTKTWLGGTPITSKSARKPSRIGSFGSDEGESTPVVTPSAKPLVRDRTGTSSLLKTTLQRTAAVGSTAAGVATPGSSTPLSRKHSLDLEGLSPAERAAQRRKLNQMSTAEKREFYAQYKGSGRYVRPEEVTRSVADEFEIDPVKNNGMKHKYHDVVRSRDARRQMHGGDCECCREYYEAIGPLPRFNQAPVWKKKDPEEDDDDDELTEHRNRVSRHRETWQRPATPPDFWKIGFPSTQDVDEMNAKADAMVREREAEVRREAERKDSKWRRKA